MQPRHARRGRGRLATQHITPSRTFIAHGRTMPGSGSPASKALPDTGASPPPETIAITQGQLPDRLNPRL